MRSRAASFAPTTSRRDRPARVRAGRPDPGAGARAGPDAAPSRDRLSRRRPRAPLSGAGRRRGRLHQLRLRAARASRADAPARWRGRVAAHAKQARAQARAGVRPRARRSASAGSRGAVRARRGHATTGAARRTRRRSCWTACTIAACCASPGATAGFASTRCASTERVPADAAARRARLDALVDVARRASTRRCPLRACRSARQALALRRAAAGAADLKARSQRARAAARACACRWHRLVLAGRRRSERRSPRDGRPSCACSRRSIRWCGTAALRAVLGLALSLRGVHATGEAQARLLRAAAAVARRGHRLGKRVGARFVARKRDRVTSPGVRRATVHSVASSSGSSRGCGRSCACDRSLWDDDDPSDASRDGAGAGRFSGVRLRYTRRRTRGFPRYARPTQEEMMRMSSLLRGILPAVLFALPLDRGRPGRSWSSTARCRRNGAGQMVAAFEKATGIKVLMTRKSSGEFYAQLKAEAANPRGDIWWGGTGDPHLQAAEEGLTERVQVAEARRAAGLGGAPGGAVEVPHGRRLRRRARLQLQHRAAQEEGHCPSRSAGRT